MTYDDIAQQLGLGSPSTDSASSYDEVMRRLTPKTPPSKQKADPVTDFGGTLRFATPLGTLDTGVQLPQSVNKMLAHIGSGLDDWLLAASQMRGNATEQDATEKRRIDAGLNTDFGGKALAMTGRVLPALAVPNVGGPFVSGAIAGGLSGLFSPVAEGESRGANTGLGAGLGAALPALLAGGKTLIKPNQETADAAATALRYGIPVAPGSMSQNPFVRAVKAITDELPIIGARGQILKGQQQRALNSAVGETFGAAAPKLSPAVIDAAKTRMGAEFDRLWGRNDLVMDAQAFTGLQRLYSLADDMPKGQAQTFKAKIDDFWSHATPNQSGAPVVPGTVANNFQQWLRTQAGGAREGYMQDAITGLRRQIIDSFNRSVSPADAAALTLNRSQYKAFKTVEPLLDKGVVGAAGRAEGDIPAALLPEAVRKSYSGLSGQTKPPPLAEIAKAASTFMVDRVPQTGGSARAALQNAGVVGGIGGAGAGLATAPWATAAGIGGGAGLNWALNSPAVSRMLLGQTQPSLLGEIGLLGLQRSPLLGLGLFSSPATE